MSRRAAQIAAVAITAAAAIAGCSTTVSGEARPSSAFKAATAEVTPDKDASPWVMPSWQGRLNSDTHGSQYGPVAVPGVVVAQDQGCTVGPIIVRGWQRGFLTAGHCDERPGETVRLFADANGEQPIDLGPITGAVDDDSSPTAVIDFGAVWPRDPSVVGSSQINRHYAVAGVMTAEAVKTLNPGTPVCISGAVTGVKCGPLLAADDHGLARIALTRNPGDSGGAVFVVAAGDRAALIGLVRGGAEDRSNVIATYLEPALDRLGADVVLDRGAAPFTGADFSPRTVTD